MTMPRSTLRVIDRVDGGDSAGGSVFEMTAAEGVEEGVEEMVEEVVGDVVEKFVDETADEAAEDLVGYENKPVEEMPEPEGITPVGKPPGRVDKKLWGKKFESCGNESETASTVLAQPTVVVVADGCPSSSACTCSRADRTAEAIRWWALDCGWKRRRYESEINDAIFRVSFTSRKS